MEKSPTQVVISYANGYRDDEALALSNRLRGDGVDCEIDKYELAPEIGWARWMEQMMGTRVVLVIPSELYSRRHKLEERPGVGLGATFESGLLAQRVLEGQGRNSDIIPVLLESTDVRFIPIFLKNVTRYDLSVLGDYENLLRRLTDQPSVVRPSLGPVRKLVANAPRLSLERQNLVLFRSESSGLFWMKFIELERGDRLRLTVSPGDHADIARIRALKNEGDVFAVAYGLDAFFVRLSGISESIRDGSTLLQLDMTEKPFDSGFGTEMSYNGITADQIAEMRARRILLDEPAPDAGGGNEGTRLLNQSMFDSFISARSSLGQRLTVNASPIPPVAEGMSADDPDTVPLLKLVCSMFLILSGAVEHISRLDITLYAHRAHIEFEGIRSRVYSNREPTRMKVSGTCPFYGGNAG